MNTEPKTISKSLTSLILKAAAGSACLLVLSCSEQEKPVAATPPVKIFTLPQLTEAPFRSFPGEVSAAATAQLSFDVPGRLTQFPVQDGQIVEPGQLIGQLDQADFRTRLDSAQARFNNARAELERANTLRQRRVIAQNEFDQQQKTFEVAQADLRTAQKAFDDTRLFAPFKGRIAHRAVRNFQNVQAQQVVVTLQNVTTLEVDVQIPENVMALVNRNITVEQARPLIDAQAEFAALPGQQFPLSLASFVSRANPGSRTFLVSFALVPPDDSNILPGMTCTVRLRFQREDGTPVIEPDVYEIPVQALLTSEGNSWVWKWDASSGNVSRVPVEMLGLTGDSIRIRATDLKPGDEIVSSGVRFLFDGMSVRRLETHKP